MIKQLSVLLSFLAVIVAASAQEKALQNGVKITKTTRIKLAVYQLDGSDSLFQPVIRIEGNNIVVDFNHATLKGSNKKLNPDEFFGTAIIVENCRNVTIKNLNVRGYKVGLLARNVHQLILENCDLGYNYRQHLNSTQEKEDISDWMSYHHNEKDEWLRYGAAIYLRNCNAAVIRNCRVTGGQNALMMTECNSGKIYNNDFSFNSGVGIAMYRSNSNEVLYNKIDFNVRGYSHGVYQRGQDSAGILIYEQSNQNIFYKNSATHCGDGFFLWAGQTTMDTGEGGCNDNVIESNDFSYAPTNGIEVTFSRNGIFRNRIFECDHGIWGGYSYGSTIADNKFRDNRIAIAIEHGQYNKITYNTFSKDKEAIRLWARKEQPKDWGYAKYRDTRSVDYIITGNSFNSNPTVINLNRTDSVNIFENTYSNFDVRLKLDSTVTNIDSTPVDMVDTTAVSHEIKNPIDPFKGIGSLAGRKNIMITEWGPYDFRYPIIWNTNPTDTSDLMQFSLYGPKGKWKIISMKGVCCPSNMTDGIGFPPTMVLKKIPASKTDIEIVMEYTGPAFVDQFGKTVTANKPYRFRFRKFFQPIDWQVNWFQLDTTAHNPLRSDGLFAANVRVRPVKTEKTDRIDYAWWGGIQAAGGQVTQFITTAEGRAYLAKGNYQLGVTWDDAVRVYVDGKLVIDEWIPSKYRFDESPHKKIMLNLGGNHHFMVEHLELGGFATLSVKLTPVE